MGNNPSHFEGKPRHPVECLSWIDAHAYLEKLNEMTGKSYRLLSEAEWEFCCRAGTTTAYHTGIAITTEQANFCRYYVGLGGRFPKQGRKTTPVDQFPANAFGLHDMHGNVWEWVEDWYHRSYDGAPRDGSAWVTGGEQQDRVLRGGSYNTDPQNVRSALRHSYKPDYVCIDHGFRVALTLQ